MTLVFSASAQLQNPKNLAYEWKTDTSNKNIDLSEIMMVLPRHSFPAIDYPAFIKREEAMNSFFAKEPVISVEINGRAKAYPLNMLTMHEISNDTLSGTPILPTYCPLCNASIVYDRRLLHNGKEYLLDFEVSGMLRKSDMIMADEQTQTWWQQLMGKAIVGKLQGAELTIIPSLVISVDEFFLRYPDGMILSPKTGSESENEYGKNPYINYDAADNTPYSRFFDSADVDMRLPAMERIVDFTVGEKSIVYPYSILKKKGVINDKFEGVDIVLFYQSGAVSVLDKSEIEKSKDVGSVTVFSPILDDKVLEFHKSGKKIQDLKTRSYWDITGRCIEGPLKGRTLEPLIYSNHFAFAWLAFYPESQIYDE